MSVPVSHSRITMFAASLASPLAVMATLVIGLLILLLGVIKLIPTDAGIEPASAVLLRLASGGVIDAPWGIYLIGALQAALGVGMLVPLSRPLAGLGCLLYAVAVVIGAVLHWSALTSDGTLNATGTALLLLVVVLIAGAALGSRAAAKRVGASA